MHIQAVNLYSLTNVNLNKKNLNNKPLGESLPQTNELPAAYRDYNVTFGAQLNRTPANFYEFNKKNLPDLMRTYLNADYEDRKNIPPAQMMKIVYDDLNQIDSLDFVRRIYVDDVSDDDLKEPLFAELTDVPTRKARKGLVSQVETLKDEMGETPLFKDGTSNFGMYLLKKIYLEGKQRKEINADFYKDLSPEYEGLITEPVDYSTFSAYGIKFPKVPFWNSFVVTRDDWNYEYKPRNPEKSRLSGGGRRDYTLSDILEGKVPQTVKPPKFKPEKFKVDRITDAIFNGHGDSHETEKQLKRKGIKDSEEISFVSRYLGEIMSVSLEKIHASDEMRDFFGSYNDMNKSQKAKLESYWRQNPMMRQLQSLAISDTIKLFFEAYGPDGNTPEFQELIEYARSIKPEREARLAQHDMKQQYYDELFAELDSAQSELQAESEEDIEEAIVGEFKSRLNNMSEEELQSMLEKEALKNGARTFEFMSPDGQKYIYVCNVDEMFEKYLRADMKILPTGFTNKYYRFMANSPLATQRYKESVALRPDVADCVKDQLMSVDEIRTVSANINREYNLKYPLGILACNDALVSVILSKLPPKPEYANILDYDTSAIIEFAENTLGITDWDEADAAKLNKYYSEYSAPITNKEEINAVNRILTDYICNFDLNYKSTGEPVFDDFIKLIAANIKRYPKYKSTLEKIIRQTRYIESCGGTARTLLHSDAPKNLIDGKCRLLAAGLIQARLDDLMPILTLSTVNIKNYISDEPIQETLMMKAIMSNNKFFC